MCVCLIQCVCKEEQGRAWQQAPSCSCSDEERGEEEEGVSMQFLSFPQPPKTKNNATLQWATVACYIIAMAPQQAKKKKKKIKKRKKKKDLFFCGKTSKCGFIFFSISLSAFHMLLWVSALSHTFSQQFRMQVDNGGKEVVKLKWKKEQK